MRTSPEQSCLFLLISSPCSHSLRSYVSEIKPVETFKILKASFALLSIRVVSLWSSVSPRLVAIIKTDVITIVIFEYLLKINQHEASWPVYLVPEPLSRCRLRAVRGSLFPSAFTGTAQAATECPSELALILLSVTLDASLAIFKPWITVSYLNSCRKLFRWFAWMALYITVEWVWHQGWLNG